MKSISVIHPAITENTQNMLMKCTPQRLIIGKPISQYTSYSAIFCPLHSIIGKEQYEKHLCNPSSHHRKYGEYIYSWNMRPISQSKPNTNWDYSNLAKEKKGNIFLAAIWSFKWQLLWLLRNSCLHRKLQPFLIS